jgi:hypothetical protein
MSPLQAGVRAGCSVLVPESTAVPGSAGAEILRCGWATLPVAHLLLRSLGDGFGSLVRNHAGASADGQS